MNYQNIYNSLIHRSRDRTLGGYTETHHIVPRCMGGTNDTGNLATLTAREHYLAHWLLWRIHRTSALAHAFFSMVRRGKGQERIISSRQYNRAKNAMAVAKRGENNYWYGTTGPMGGRTHTAEWKAAHSDRMRVASEYKRGLSVEDIPGLKAGEATRFTKGQEAWNKGLTGESHPLHGRVLPEEHKQKLRKPKPLVQCPYCGIIGGASSTKRWHFENCKKRPNTTE